MTARSCALFALMLGPALLTAETDGFPDDDLEARTEAVNEGDLRFLASPPPGRVHHHQNRIIIDNASLENGWVVMKQCHENLDAVPWTQIVYHPDRVRALRIARFHNVRTADLDDTSVQLHGVEKDAWICLELDSRALHRLEAEGRYVLRNGPFMRRFLDGYYPMRVSMDIRFPAETLKLIEYSPHQQPGLSVAPSNGGITLDGWFEGQLITEFVFCRTGLPGCDSRN